MPNKMEIEDLWMHLVTQGVLTGGVHAARPVEEVPEIRLQAWHVFELEDGDRHFSGFNITEGEGRVSSKIVEWDPIKRIGRTRSGRLYELVGESRYNGDASYTWDRWKRINNIDVFKDVSDQYESVKE